MPEKQRREFDYKCGHHTDGMIVMQGNSPLAMSEYLTWKDSTGVSGTMEECFDCFLKRTIEVEQQILCRRCGKPKGEHFKGAVSGTPYCTNESPQCRSKKFEPAPDKIKR